MFLQKHIDNKLLLQVPLKYVETGQAVVLGNWGGCLQ